MNDEHSHSRSAPWTAAGQQVAVVTSPPMTTRRTTQPAASLAALLVAAVLATLATVAADDSARLLTVDHYVHVRSSVPAIAGQDAQLYVRERVKAGTLARGGAGSHVVLFVHGAGTPAEVSFDVPYKDYSWMAYLANAGFDAFSVDMSGYGRSVRPVPMNDPCNLSADTQKTFVPLLLAAPCPPAYPHQLTTMTDEIMLEAWKLEASQTTSPRGRPPRPGRRPGRRRCPPPRPARRRRERCGRAARPWSSCRWCR